MFEFKYMMDSTPSHYSFCVIWTKRKDEKTGETWISMNSHLAQYEYDKATDRMLWKFSDTGEIANNQDVVKYIEIPKRYWSGIIEKGKPMHRLKSWLHGIRLVEKEKRYNPKLYTPTFKRKVFCEHAKRGD